MKGFFDKEKFVKKKWERKTPRPVKDNGNALSAHLEGFEVKILKRITDELGRSYVQGFTVCPVCGGRADYTWYECRGFTEFDCPGKICLQQMIGRGMIRNPDKHK